MFYHNNALTSSHPYSSQPISWPFLLRGVSFWTKGEEIRQQIYFIGNPIGWWLAVGFLAVFTGIIAADQVTRRRGVESIEERNIPPSPVFLSRLASQTYVWVFLAAINKYRTVFSSFIYIFPDIVDILAVRHRLYNSIGYFFLAWAAHYFPFYLMGRQLFLHHYLPAHLASCLVTGGLTQFLFSRGFDGPVSPGVVIPGTRLGARSASSRKPPGSAGATSGPAVEIQDHDQMVLRAVGAVIVLGLVGGFVWFAPLTYGVPGCSVERLLKMKWLDTWDFHFTK